MLASIGSKNKKPIKGTETRNNIKRFVDEPIFFVLIFLFIIYPPNACKTKLSEPNTLITENI